MADPTAQPKTLEKKTALEHVHLPRITVKFCTQCRWMLRAAYVGPISCDLSHSLAPL